MKKKMKKFKLSIIILLIIFMVINVDGVHKKKGMRSRRTGKDIRRLKKKDGAVKLVGGKYNNEGNVEILHEGKWGNICDDEWDHLEATIVCRQLGFDGAIEATRNARFGQARRRFWLNNMFCDGTEQSLSKCRFDHWGNYNCDSSEAAGVICIDEERPKKTYDYQSKKSTINDSYKFVKLRLANGQNRNEGRVEIKLGNDDWGAVCGDGWSLLEAGVVCRQLNFGYASKAIQINYSNNQKLPISMSGIKCRGNEKSISDCLHDTIKQCPGNIENVASVICKWNIADLVVDHVELMRTAHLEDRELYKLQCAMEENCIGSQAYKIQRQSNDWHRETRRLLKFTAKILNSGTDDFRPNVPKKLWEWHMCHMHYHSMEVFATFDIIDSTGKRVAEGHKASFCLEDNQCMPGTIPRYKCANYGDQGIRVNCSDIYRYNIDCQWVDISELLPGQYTFKVAVNPEFKVGEMSFENNAADCKLLYTESFAIVHSCKLGRP
ncbi:hypothetical protein HCN44_002569 [Aphidius gifuensis]|uniref:protein-lysine 6-oxidase n=1 Tax=Aphidius gifuensis TaxID=684658 RepID=A0A834Y3W9_APHGI|nr:lysyl oxidase homolog 2-like [Aphidius gifuensis]KAF7996923.1 hypothetical protein HCN44_002569 [Aphidius gifuensis]